MLVLGLIIGAILGLVLGWLLWYRRWQVERLELASTSSTLQRRTVDLDGERHTVSRLTADLEGERQSVIDLRSDAYRHRTELAAMQTSLAETTAERDTATARTEDLELALASARAELETRTSEYATATSALTAAEARCAEHTAEASHHAARAAELTDLKAAVARVTGERDVAVEVNRSTASSMESLRATLDVTGAELEAVREERDAAVAALAAAEAPGPAAPSIDLTVGEPDAHSVAAAVASGTASFLGPEPVEELRANPDELQRINGIGPYLEALLNRNGIYTFRQIARLTDEGVRDLDTQLESFKGRIERDDWLAQAANLVTV